MEYIGIDVHKRDSQACILTEGGEVVLEQRLRTRGEDRVVRVGQAGRSRACPA